MKILVTGGAGFIASHIVDAYIKLGHKIVIVDNLSTGQRRFINAKAKFYEIDIRDQKRVAEVFGKEKPDVLNHHAAQMEVRRSVSDPVYDAEVNILGLINLMEEGRRHSLKKVIFASSGGAVYGDTPVIPTPETQPALPSSPYGISKLASEYYLHFYYQTHDITYVTLRYGNVYGPRQNPYGEAGVVAIFAQKMLKGEQPIINGDGEQTRDFIYVEDVVEANVLALSVEKVLTVNIGTAIATSVNQIFDSLTQKTHTSFKKVHGQAKLGEQRQSVLDIKLSRKMLKWQPNIDISQGLTYTVDYFENEAIKK